MFDIGEATQTRLEQIAESKYDSLRKDVEIAERFNTMVDNLEFQRDFGYGKTLTKDQFHDLLTDINECWGNDNIRYYLDEMAFVSDCGKTRSSYYRMKCEDRIPIAWMIDYCKRIVYEKSVVSAQIYTYHMYPEMANEIIKLRKEVEKLEQRVTDLENTVAEQNITIRYLSTR